MKMANPSGNRLSVDGGGNDIGRPPKKPQPSVVETSTTRTPSSGQNVETGLIEEGRALALPPEVWANAMNYLEYPAVLSCAAASKAMLRDALPLVTALHVDGARQLNRLVSRFRDVRELNVCSLIKENVRVGVPPIDSGDLGARSFPKFAVDEDSLMRLELFLSRLPKLEQVFLGGKMSNGEVIGSCPGDELLGATNVCKLIGTISKSFRLDRGLPKHVRVLGLRCPNSYKPYSHRGNSPFCEVCREACRSFPIESVLNFENQGSSETGACEFSCKRRRCLDVCLSRSQLENIVKSRPGGRALLSSDAHFLRLLGRGRLYEIPSDGGASLYLVKFTWEELAGLRRVLECAPLATKNIDREDIVRAIMRSFKKDERGSVPPSNRRFLSRSSICFLENRLGLSISEEDFGYEAANRENFPLIAKAMLDDDTGIQEECASLLCELVRVEANLPIQQIVDLGVVPKLVQFLQPGSYMTEFRNPICLSQAAAMTLGHIVEKGTNAHTQALASAGAISALVRLKSSTDHPAVAEACAFALKKIAHDKDLFSQLCQRKTQCHRNLIERLGGALLPP